MNANTFYFGPLILTGSGLQSADTSSAAQYIGDFTGSVQGTASYAVLSDVAATALQSTSASYALTASYAMNAGGGSGMLVGTTIITGSLIIASDEGIGPYSSSVSNYGALAVGVQHTASGLYGVAFGEANKALGYASLAQGGGTVATSYYAHAEGVNTTAVDYAHSEGQDTKALSQTSHAEGYQTTAKAFAAHAEGYGTIASANYQHVQGQWNVEDTNALFVIGDGTSNGTRSNVVAVYTDKATVTGSLNVSGSITLNGSAITAGGGGTSPTYFMYSGSHLYTTSWQTVNIPTGTVTVDTTKNFRVDFWGFEYAPDDFFGQTYQATDQCTTLWSTAWNGQKQVFNLGTATLTSGQTFSLRANYPGSGSNLQFQWKSTSNMALPWIIGVGGTVTYL